MLSSRGSFQPRDEPASPVAPALQADSLRMSHWGSPCTGLYSQILSHLGGNLGFNFFKVILTSFIH